MGLSKNKAVDAAYKARKYTDATGTEWRRGMDGWFLDDVDDKGGFVLIRHPDMVAKIENENPE